MSEKLFESIKRIIESGMYNKGELIVKIERLQEAGRLTRQEAMDLLDMLANV